MEGGGKSEKKRIVVESLGWLTESSIMPKKHRAIEGVGASSILELKAQLYKTQEEAKKAKELAPDIEFHRAKKKIVSHDVLSQKNSGVDARAHKDKLELKAVKDGSASYAALEKKAELYDKLVRGELPDEEEQEKYCVDFFQKGLVEDDTERPPQGTNISGISGENGDDDRDATMFNAKPLGPGRMAGGIDNDEHKRFVREVHVEVNQAREKASTLKMQRQEQATARREKLRQAYLRKQLEKLKAAAQKGES
ncbi:hypothetical protein IFM89_011761 [Coptis chinensis]|uniref:Uncharacterized protein n=1 Tax=Coptis chinensis TaxID=261450 RepID=A0A835IPE7_9MAGN|nr:hypothetical protein IFM89_011761 [Coptis chinensis]